MERARCWTGFFSCFVFQCSFFDLGYKESGCCSIQAGASYSRESHFGHGGTIMVGKDKLEPIRLAFKKHIGSDSPLTNTVTADGVDLLALETSVCNLLANYLSHDGDLEKVEKQLKEAGMGFDFATALQSKMSLLRLVASDMGDEQEQYLMQLYDVASEVYFILEPEDSSINMKQTMDLDEELKEFRKLVSKSPPE